MSSPLGKRKLADRQLPPRPGDENLPVVTDGGEPLEWVMPHAIAMETQTSWKARVQRTRFRPSEFWRTSVFQHTAVTEGNTVFTPRNYVVGEEALSGARQTKLTGPQKYKKEYLEVLMLAALLKVYPDGHDNLIVGCAHTTDSVAHVETITNVLNGVHRVTRPDGVEITYKIRAVIPWDEPVGGLVRFMTRPYAEYNEHDIQVGNRLLVVDIGGKVSSMYPVLIVGQNRFQVMWSAGRPLELGIQDVFAELRQQLPDLYPDTFKVRTIPEDLLRQCVLHRGQMIVRNEPFDATQAYMNSIARLLDLIQNFYENEMDGALNINHIVVTGGGGGLVFDSLAEIFGHRYIYLADDLDTINLANLRGGMVSIMNYHADPRRPEFPWLGKKNIKHRLNYFLFDPGNSDLKFRKVETAA